MGDKRQLHENTCLVFSFDCKEKLLGQSKNRTKHLSVFRHNCNKGGIARSNVLN